MRVRTSGQENFVWKTSYEINWKGNFFFGYGCTGVNLTKLSLGIVADFRMLKFRTLNDDKQKSIWTISRYFRQTDFFLIFSFLWQARWWQGLLYKAIHHYEYVTNTTECPTGHWLTISHLLTTHVWPTNHLSDTFTVILILISRFLNFILPN